MLTSKKITLKPLFESADGIHLTAYLVNRGRFADLKLQLKETINQAYECLSPVLSSEELKKFLDPIDALLEDPRILKQMKANVGIFRNKDTFRVLNVPVNVEQTCQVATSFHIKPLLKWLQTDKEFLLLGLENDAAHLYWGSQESFKLIDSVLLPETFTWLNDWISELTKQSKPKLFIAGEKSIVDSLSRSLKYKNIVKKTISDFYTKNNISQICSRIRELLKAESKVEVEKTLAEFRFAEEDHRARKNIFQISKAVVRGRVRKLVVSEEHSIFGKIDKESGGLQIHPFDLDHEDDDILDDLAQMVLSQGGEVIVASRDEMPKGRPILAILDDDGLDLQKADSSFEYDSLQERLG